MDLAIFPTQKTERIQALDFLRGIAILGILIMNIQSFSMPEAAYLNPMAYGDITGLNQCVWVFSHFFADQKFMTIFSLLFGAGIILITEKAEAKYGKSAGLHYRRTFWLLVIGLIHAHLIWHGDILVTYALCGFFVYLFRKKSPRTLFIVGTLLISVHTVLYLFSGASLSFWPEEDVQEIQSLWAPTAEVVAKEIAAYTGSLGEQISQNSSTAFTMQTQVFLLLFFWRAGGLMLVGMALYKWGVLTAKRSKSFYQKGLLIGWLIGFPLVGIGYFQNEANEWHFSYSMFIGSQWNYWGSLFVSFGHICGVMLISLSDKLFQFKRRIAAVGRMALTNYIAQSLIGVFIFYGIGLGLFGEVERIWQFVITLCVWALQIVWSKPWLDRNAFGPLEWLWRSLTYGKVVKQTRAN